MFISFNIRCAVNFLWHFRNELADDRKIDAYIWKVIIKIFLMFANCLNNNSKVVNKNVRHSARSSKFNLNAFALFQYCFDLFICCCLNTLAGTTLNNEIEFFSSPFCLTLHSWVLNTNGHWCWEFRRSKRRKCKFKFLFDARHRKNHVFYGQRMFSLILNDETKNHKTLKTQR